MNRKLTLKKHVVKNLGQEDASSVVGGRFTKHCFRNISRSIRQSINWVQDNDIFDFDINLDIEDSNLKTAQISINVRTGR